MLYPAPAVSTAACAPAGGSAAAVPAAAGIPALAVWAAADLRGRACELLIPLFAAAAVQQHCVGGARALLTSH